MYCPRAGLFFSKQDGIKMEVEGLFIRPREVEITYLFTNTTDKDITTQVLFPLPAMPALDDYYEHLTPLISGFG